MCADMYRSQKGNLKQCATVDLRTQAEASP
jgi:hypothetical protein